MEQALAINREVLSEKHPQTVTLLNNLGALLQAQADYAGARPYLEQALAIRKQALGERHPHKATSLNNFGLLLQLQGDYADARPYQEQALAIYREVLGENHPLTALALINLASLSQADGNLLAAVAQFDQSRRVIRRHVARVLPTLSAKEQSMFLSNEDQVSLHFALSLGYLHSEQPEIAQRSAAWLANGKAVAQEALAQQAIAARESQDPAIGKAVGQLHDVRRQLAAMALSLPKPGQETAHRQRIDQLQREEEQLARKMAQAKGESFRAEPWIELAAVREAIPPQAVLIDIARFTVFNVASQSKKDEKLRPRYVAWIIPPAGPNDVKVVDLGEAQAIDAAVQAVRKTLQASAGASGTIVDQGEADAETLLKKPLAELARLVLEPLTHQVGEAQQLILSPDAALWLAPWGALPLADGRYAIEEYQIRYVVSGRDLVAQPSAKTQTAQPIIMADPNFDLGPKETAAATQAVLRTAKSASGQLRSVEPASTSTGLPKVARLLGTAEEAKAVMPKLQAYAGSAPIVYTDQWALEGVFKAVKRPKILVMSTHGFFLPDQEVTPDKQLLASSDTRAAALTTAGKPIENPLLRCGMLLAGCNASDQAASAGGEDGVLTGLEIVGTDLRGTELVVLSACETGLGQVRNGEGVAGLRQAFQLAGAQAVVATLWQIPDQESAQLMTDFFTNLAAGQSRSDALRTAQLARINARREKHSAAHPFLWAAYTLTGR